MPLQDHPIQVALTIAGSDPSGGAGIQADLKTFTALGVYAGAVITALTVQNTRGVFAIQPVEPSFVKDQIVTVLSDLTVSHIKIGMIGSAAVAKVICETLADFSGEIIYDPVLVSSSGQQLFDGKDLLPAWLQVLAVCTVLTPNLPELALLSAQECSTPEMLNAAAQKLLLEQEKLRSVIVTGGHWQTGKELVTDYLFTATGDSMHVSTQEISHPRIASRNTHGTGCTFSAAFTAFHLQTGDDSESFHRATGYMDKLIRSSALFKIGHGTGPLMHHLNKG